MFSALFSKLCLPGAAGGVTLHRRRGGDLHKILFMNDRIWQSLKVTILAQLPIELTACWHPKPLYSLGFQLFMAS